MSNYFGYRYRGYGGYSYTYSQPIQQPMNPQPMNPQPMNSQNQSATNK